MSLRPNSVRKKSYKTGVDRGRDEARRRREDNLVEIRKNKREDNLLKKRREGLLLHPQQQQQQLLDTSQNQYPHTEKNVGKYTFDGARSLVRGSCITIRSDDSIQEATIYRMGFDECGIGDIEHGAVPKFVKLLTSTSDDVREQAVWALGNVAGDSPNCRDLVLRSGTLVPLLAQLNEPSKLSMLRNATWTLSNFCRGKPPTSFEQVKPALLVLQQLIHFIDEEVLTDACWALSYPFDGPNDKIQYVIKEGVCPRLIDLLLHPSPTVLYTCPANGGEYCYRRRCSNSEFEIKKEAAWAISNAMSGGSHEQIQFLLSQGCIKPLCDLLVCPDPRIVTVCLEGLENIVRVGEADKEMGKNGGINLYAQMINECDGLDKIENLQTHDNNEIYEKAVKILERYWAEEPDEEKNLANGGFDANQQPVFTFGANEPSVPVTGFKFE